MAAQQPADYTIFCVTVDKNSTFVVDISPHKTVAHLKDAIKTKKSHAFDNFDADELNLYLIDPAKDGSLTEKVEKLLAGQPPPLEPTEELSVVFPDPPVKGKGKVHILVQPPRAGEFLRAGIRRMTRLTNHPRCLLISFQTLLEEQRGNAMKYPRKRRI